MNQPGLKEFLHENNLLFEDIFEIKEANGQEGIFCSDVAELVKRVSSRRGHANEAPLLFKLGIDSGRGSLKASVSLLFEDDPLLQIEEIPSKRRQTYRLRQDLQRDDGSHLSKGS